MADSHQRRRAFIVSLPVLAVAAISAGGMLAADDKGGDIHAAARAAVAAGQVAKTDALGFTLEKKSFSDLPADGGILVGFDVALAKFVKDDCVSALRPIYRIAQGETTTQDFGLFHAPMEFGPKKRLAPKQVTRTERLLARSDYAVGAINLRTSVNIRGMSLTFMRVNGRSLDPSQSYTSNWIGDDKGGREVSVGGHGAPIVGIFGNQNDAQQVVALGLIYLNDGTAAVASAPATPAIPKRGRSSRTQPAKPSQVDRLKELVSKEEAAAAQQDQAAAEPPAPSEAQQNSPAAESAAAAKTADEEEIEKEAIPIWQSWKVMAPAALAILLVCVALGVQRFRPTSGVDVVMPRPAGASPVRLSPGAIRRATAPPATADDHKVLKGVSLLVIGVLAAFLGHQLAKGKLSKPGVFREFTSAEGKFRVEMPGSPIEETAYAVGIPLVTFRVEEKDGAYGVAYADIPMPDGISSAQLKRALDSARDGMVRNVNGKFLGESSIRLDGKYPGREVRAELPIPDGLIKGRLYLVGRRVYMVMVTGVSSWVNSANAKRFLDSLEITR